jgi:hypothetical protein
VAALSDPARTGRLRRSGAQWDQELHGRILLGDADAFDELYDQYAPMVYGMALRVIRDHTAAADITQEVFAGFWEQPEGFNPGRGTLRSWMACSPTAARSTGSGVSRSGEGPWSPRRSTRRRRCPTPKRPQ